MKFKVIEGQTNHPPDEYYLEKARLLKIIDAGNRARVDLDRLEHRYPMSWAFEEGKS